MACVNADGTLTPSAQSVLGASRQPVTPAEIAAKVGLPLFRVRSSLRELVEAGLLQESDGRYQTTPSGIAQLSD